MSGFTPSDKYYIGQTDPKEPYEHLYSSRSTGRGYHHGEPDFGSQFIVEQQVPRVAAQNIDPTIQQINPTKPTVPDAEDVQRFIGFGVGFTSLLTDHLIGYPAVVLRRQCQVHRKALRYHLTPFTLLPVIVKLQRRQGLGPLWKGIGSVFITKGLSMASETALAEFLPFPRELTPRSTLKQIAQHILLKGLTIAIITPFYCSSLVETVQSSIASENPGVLDCIKEGLFRIFRWGTPRTARLLPIWILIAPTVLHGLLHYVISSLVQSVTEWILQQNTLRRQEKLVRDNRNSSIEQYYAELMASFTGRLTADLILFPLETVLHRLYLQGTRTIIDNLDNGIAVTPATTGYEGLFDCFQTIVDEEGAAGLYKGFGALVLQYTLQGIVLKATKLILNEMINVVNCARGH